ncbi:hypothetical protein [Polyangium sorediatum]|uniref:Uncharacterized protein n=1 Tax=Polyangium sorediatum TaxID=889274 RepID=A0ABT6NPC7_9BACT|nr:hypothetical protein [Polyangium sorediatum]MDI1430158.1 hypothetical protein [Polyangium sorediatum]
MDRESLEVKLDALIEEMRVELATELAAAAETKGPSVHVTGLLPPTSKGTDEAEAPKIIVGKGVDPRAELTIVGRRSDDGAEWIFDGVEEDADSQGIHAPLTRSDAPVERVVVAEATPRRRAPVVAIAGAVVGAALTWLLLGNGGAIPVLQAQRLPRELFAATTKPAERPEAKAEMGTKAEEPVKQEKKVRPPAASQSTQKSVKTMGRQTGPRTTGLETEPEF